MPSARSLGNRVTCILLALIPTIASVGTLGNVPSTAHEAPTILFLGGILCAFPLRTQSGARAGPTTIWVLYLATLIVALVRFMLAPVAPFSVRILLGYAATIVSLALFVYVAVAHAEEGRARERVYCILFGPTILATLSLLLYMAQVHVGASDVTNAGTAANNGQGELFSAIGLSITREVLPLYQSLNAGGAIGVISLVIGASLCRGTGTRRVRRMAILAIVMGLVTVFYTDSRGPLIFGILALVLVWALPRASSAALNAVPLIIPFAPFIILFFTQKLLGGVSVSLSRNGADFASATGRQFVWNDVLHLIGHLNVQTLIGWGAVGQVKSGVGYQYAYVFPDALHPALSSAHNGVLQTVLDSGWIGAIVLVAMLVTTITSLTRRYRETASPQSLALLAGVLAIALFGADEPIPTLNNIYLLATFIAFVGAALRVPDAPASYRQTAYSHTVGRSKLLNENSVGQADARRQRLTSVSETQPHST